MPDITICRRCNKETYASLTVCPRCGGQITRDDKLRAREILAEKEKTLQASFRAQDAAEARRKELAEEQGAESR